MLHSPTPDLEERLGGASSYVGDADRVERTPTVDAAGIRALVAERLDRVDALFRVHLASPVRIVHEIGDFVADGGGKRVRPTLHLLAADLCGYRGLHDVLLATVLEFIHSATLIHDDIIDESLTRRGRPSVHVRWGNNVTVLFGDYLYAKAMEMALEAGSLEVMRRLAEITLRMTEGEMLQTRYVGRLDLTVEEHLDLVERKTAVLFAGCCDLAGILAGAEPSRTRALARYGTGIGMAFQIVDDLLDFTGDARTLGKPAGSDLREGKVTLALIDLLANEPVRARALASRAMEDGRAGATAVGELTTLLRESGALERARCRARDYAREALAELSIFPDGPARRALESVAQLLVLRDR